jgi:hypothetical protein
MSKAAEVHNIGKTRRAGEGEFPRAAGPMNPNRSAAAGEPPWSHQEIWQSREFRGLLKFFKAKARDPRFIEFLRPGDRIMALTIRFRADFKPRGRVDVGQYGDALCQLQLGATPESIRANESSRDFRDDIRREFRRADEIRREAIERRELARERKANA